MHTLGSRAQYSHVLLSQSQVLRQSQPWFPTSPTLNATNSRMTTMSLPSTRSTRPPPHTAAYDPLHRLSVPTSPSLRLRTSIHERSQRQPQLLSSHRRMAGQALGGGVNTGTCRASARRWHTPTGRRMAVPTTAPPIGPRRARSTIPASSVPLRVWRLFSLVPLSSHLSIAESPRPRCIWSSRPIILGFSFRRCSRRTVSHSWIISACLLALLSIIRPHILHRSPLFYQLMPPITNFLSWY